MKEVIYGFGIQQEKELQELAEKATKTLDDLLGNEANDVSAEWDYGPGSHARPVFILRISDSDGSASAAIDPEEMKSAKDLRWRLRRLWGALLRVKSHKRLEALMSWGPTTEEQ